MGGIRYAEDSEILMLGYAHEADEPTLWIPNIPATPGVKEMLELEGFIVQRQPPKDLVDHLNNPYVNVWAHNAEFERAVIENPGVRLGMPKPKSDRYRCTAAMSRYLALPSALEDIARYLKLIDQKDTGGKDLINKYCKPQKPTKKNGYVTRYALEENLDDYTAFGEYCLQDVRTERAVHKKLEPVGPPPVEWGVYRMTSDINFRGLPIDVPTVEKAKALLDEYLERETEISVELCGLRPTQNVKLKAWVNKKLEPTGIPPLENMQADTLEDLKKDPRLPELVKKVVIIKGLAGMASVKKVGPMLTTTSADGRNRGSLVYHGATTSRWTAKRIQMHNLAKPKYKGTKIALDFLRTETLDFIEFMYESFTKTLSGCIRHFIHTKPGRSIIAADYSSIEARVLCFLSGQDSMTKLYWKDIESKRAYRAGKISAQQRAKEKILCDPYIDMASTVYGIPHDKITSDQRALGKCIILGCGFGMGKKTFYETCLNWGLEVSKDLAYSCIDAFRCKDSKVKQLWDKVNSLAVLCVQTRTPQQYRGLKFSMRGGFLFIRMPSGRNLSYPRAKVEMVKAPWGAKVKSVTFYGHIKGTKWGRVSTYGGKLVENIVQGYARDIMAHGMLVAESAGYLPIGTIHDEGLSEVPDGFGSVEEYEKLLCTLPDYAKGMPIEADGFRDIMYKKD